ncbi:uncharacterized protein LOC21409575 [Morus notabilis]|nr:uncharacterized protein LOC21409575 [Morus notabilis]
MPHKRLRVAVLLSGGVDSSVTWCLLHAAGHSYIAFYLKIWFQDDFENFWSECPWEEDLKYAKVVCSQIEVPLEVVHLTDEYWKNVVSYIIDEYRCGRTPNPDVLCNTRIKFGSFMDAISSREFDYIASGHYANVVSFTNERGDASVLELSQDMIFEKNHTKIDNYGIWPRYQSRIGYHNMYKELCDTTLNGIVEQMYNEMASRHKVRFSCIQIIKTAIVPAKLCKRESTKQFHNSTISSRWCTRRSNHQLGS